MYPNFYTLTFKKVIKSWSFNLKQSGSQILNLGTALFFCDQTGQISWLQDFTASLSAV